jgi:photoactive yellow protein
MGCGRADDPHITLAGRATNFVDDRTFWSVYSLTMSSEFLFPDLEFTTGKDRSTFDLGIEELDALPIGVITLDRRGNVLRYNRIEAEYARRTTDSTLNKNFFTDIAPCSRVQEFQGRYEAFAAVNDNGYERFDFTFPFRWGHREVEILFCRRRDVEPIDIIVTTRHRPVLEIDIDAPKAVVRRREREPITVRLMRHDAIWHDDLISGRTVWSRECYDLVELDSHDAPPMGGLRAFADPSVAEQLDLLVQAAIDARVAYGFEHRIITARGTERYVQVSASITYDSAGRAISILGRAGDVTDRCNEETDLWDKANFDRLTGLANRICFETSVENALNETGNIGRTLGIVFIDLDRFKAINDTFGHVVGDEVLRVVSRRLEASTRPEDLVARLSGDEFVILIAGFDNEGIVDSLCARIIANLTKPIVIEGRAFEITASLGVALYPRHGLTVDDLLHAADAAMYESKSSSTVSVVRFNEDLQHERHDRATLEHDLHRALAERALELYYQPIVASGTHVLASVEALIRWNHPTRGIVPPGEFISIAEGNGDILTIGAWVIASACTRVRTSIDAGLPARSVAVNVSLVQFRSPAFVASVRSALAHTNIPPEFLTLELTESVASGNFYETMRTLAELKTLGVKLAIDDFGTGYSSLAYLKHFPIDSIKLDRAFVADILTDPIDHAIAETVVALAKKLHLEVIAEGVETIEQARCMEAIGCHKLQGFLFSKPISEREFFGIFAVAGS